MAQASYLSETASNSDVTINYKTGTKTIESIEVAKVEFEGTQSGWSDISSLPKNVTWTSVLSDTNGGTAGTYTLKFTYTTKDGKTTIEATATKG